ncbi:hypothetical protein [uncultured Brevundimonas sp.]|mgnify:CR=1 FL=1|jgi:hypothetical protein|uniref:hypothetical protein n=1 Tax=Brevundimonas sp. CEF1 TaxID=3442642 RepID=UPI000FAD77AB|nr:hypothetical protein [uncultured Brevundimonas sp.]
MKHALTLIAMLGFAWPAHAQTGTDDWDMNRDPAQKLVMAYTAFDNGLGIGARCSNGSFQVLISGLPPATGATRNLGIALQDAEVADQRWNIAENPTVAISDMPSPLARQMRKGGSMQVVVPAAEGDQRLRYVLDLPASSTAIDEVLQACDRPLVDARDAELEALQADGLPLNLEWARPPRPNYPEGKTYTRGFATITCLTRSDGGVRDCVVETEHPIDGGFGEAAIDATRRARLRSKDGGEVLPGMIGFRTNFLMETAPVTGRRLRPN